MKLCNKQDTCPNRTKCSFCAYNVNIEDLNDIVKIGDVSKDMFLQIVSETTIFYSKINKIEKALGDIELTTLSKYADTVISALQSNMGITFTDDIYSIIHFGYIVTADEDNNNKKIKKDAEYAWKLCLREFLNN